jgi:hypothetical protein
MIGNPPIIIILISISRSFYLLSYSSNYIASCNALNSSSTSSYLCVGGFYVLFLDSSLAFSFNSLFCAFNSSFSFFNFVISYAYDNIFLVVPDSSSLSCLLVYCALRRSCFNRRISCLACISSRLVFAFYCCKSVCETVLTCY